MPTFETATWKSLSIVGNLGFAVPTGSKSRKKSVPVWRKRKSLGGTQDGQISSPKNPVLLFGERKSRLCAANRLCPFQISFVKCALTSGVPYPNILVAFNLRGMKELEDHSFQKNWKLHIFTVSLFLQNFHIERNKGLTFTIRRIIGISFYLSNVIFCDYTIA